MTRKQASGSDNRKRKAARDKLQEDLAGSMDRFVKPKTNPVVITVDNDLHETLPNVDALNETATNDNTLDETAANDNSLDENTSVDGVLGENINGSSLNVNATVVGHIDDIYDPGNWNKYMSQGERDLLVEKGPIRFSDVDYPVVNGRSFGDSNYTRTLGNGEKYDRKWLVYSRKKDRVYCFCCVLFKKGAQSPITSAGGGYNDWHNIHSRLEEHEKSRDHIDSLTAWIETETRLKKKITIDAKLQNAIEKERKYWKEVMKRVMFIVKGLATSNLAFRGSKEKIDDDNNGNFLKIVHIVAEFDPILKEHLRRIRKKETRVHYLGHNIQNELIVLLASEVKSTILKNVKEAKYFSVILDCTPDISHEEQMTLILRCVITTTSPIRVEEYFIEFLKVVETTGEALFHELQRALEDSDLNLNDVRGQGYDNGSNMKGL